MRHKGGENKNWTEKNIENYKYFIVSDFLDQLSNFVLDRDVESISEIISLCDSLYNNPEKATIEDLIKIAREFKLKLSLVILDDGDKENFKGPISGSLLSLKKDIENV